ncbi:hypothetical protein LJR219_002340 [Phenylobacterium sp. LjRoot219]|uniref:hypothetical protein n=1 Tax=Phenylobacterium sp. LjRoot219 TaxID=3342283 RepID=UPI003ECF446B
MTPGATIFVVSMQAVAGPENADPDGRCYDLLVFARAATEAEAEAVAHRGLAQLGWIEAQALRSGEITDPDAVPDDFRRSFETAQAVGCAVIVYDEP